MANILTQNPVKLTQVMLTSYKAQVAAALGTLTVFRVEKIYWEGAVSNGDVMSITDPLSGNVLAHVQSLGANTSYWIDWSAHPRLWADFILSTLGSGTVYIYKR